MTIKDRLKLISGTLTSPLIGLIIGFIGIVEGYYSMRYLNTPNGIISVVVGSTITIIAILDSMRILIEKKIDEVKDLIKDSTISVPRYKRDTREPIGPNYTSDLESKVAQK